MNHLKQTACLLMAVLVCMAHPAAAWAADEAGGVAWVSVTENADRDTDASIVTDTSVTDGVVALTYDSSVLTYEGVSMDEASVAMYSVNADEDGVVRISWVAPDDTYNTQGREMALVTVSFSGSVEDAQDPEAVFGLEEGSMVSAADGGDGNADRVSFDVTRIVLDTNDGAGETKPEETKPGETKPGGSNTTGGNTPSGGNSTSGNNGGAGSAFQGTQTGDQSHLTLYAVLFVAAAAGIAAAVVVRKRRGGK